MQFRKKPVVIEATQWFKNGDHPLDYANHPEGAAYARAHHHEGEVVRRLSFASNFSESKCKHCGNPPHAHGWIDTLEGGHTVCPSDWIITGVKGEMYPVKDEIFNATYEAVG